MAKNTQIIELPPKGERFKSLAEQYPNKADYKRAEAIFLNNYRNVLNYFQQASMDDGVDFNEISLKFEKIVICALKGYCKINWEEFNPNIIKNNEVKKKAVAFKNLVDGRYDAVIKRSTQIYKLDGELAD